MEEHQHKVHFLKRVKSSQRFGVFEEKVAKFKVKQLFCVKCEFNTKKISNFKRHNKLHDV